MMAITLDVSICARAEAELGVSHARGTMHSNALQKGGAVERIQQYQRVHGQMPAARQLLAVPQDHAEVSS